MFSMGKILMTSYDGRNCYAPLRASQFRLCLSTLMVVLALLTPLASVCCFLVSSSFTTRACAVYAVVYAVVYAESAVITQ